MTASDRLQRYLRDNQIPFDVQHHAPAYTAQRVAASEHVPGRRMVKAVLAIADGERVMLVLPATHRVDLHRAATMLGARQVRLASEEEVAAALPDCELGAMSPFGSLYQIPVYVDRSFAEEGRIVVEDGSPTETISLEYADFTRLVSPTVGAFAYHE